MNAIQMKNMKTTTKITSIKISQTIINRIKAGRIPVGTVINQALRQAVEAHEAGFVNIPDYMLRYRQSRFDDLTYTKVRIPTDLREYCKEHGLLISRMIDYGLRNYTGLASGL